MKCEGRSGACPNGARWTCECGRDMPDGQVVAARVNLCGTHAQGHRHVHAHAVKPLPVSERPKRDRRKAA